MTEDRAQQIKQAWDRVRSYATTEMLRGPGLNASLLPIGGLVTSFGKSRRCLPDLVTFKIEWSDLPLPGGGRLWRIVADGVEVETGAALQSSVDRRN